ncbi:MAG: hypothetical protein EB127_09960 [Alphaproteobacteria bacterium]|nr:hypothetical protein [Alphaproteobacteria bacterium]
MYQITIIVFREFLEISLLIGFLSAIGKDIKNFKIILSLGIMLGILCSSLLALCTDQISSSLEGVGGEVFDAAIILTSVVLICITLTWFKRQTTSISNTINKVESDDFYSKIILTFLIATTIFREGAEIVLLLHSFLAINKNEGANYAWHFVLGATLGCLSGLALYAGLFQFARKRIFAITSFFMTFIGAGLAAEAAKILTSIGFMSELSVRVWDTSAIIQDDSIFGRLLKILLGYSAKPNLAELIFYLSTILIIMISGKVFAGKKTT